MIGREMNAVFRWTSGHGRAQGQGEQTGRDRDGAGEDDRHAELAGRLTDVTDHVWSDKPARLRDHVDERKPGSGRDP